MRDDPAVEAILARLMPAALSEGATDQMDAMLDELAGPDDVVRPPARRRRVWLIGGGVAAAVVLSVTAWLRPQAPVAGGALAVPASSRWVLVSNSDSIEAITDDGWREAPEGGAMRAMVVQAVEKTSVYDQMTGIVMQVSQPRDELVLVPVTSF